MSGIEFGTYGYKAMHHLLLNNDFEIIQALEDPLLNLIDSRILKAQVDGQSHILKLLMDDTFHMMATKDGEYNYDVNPGTPRIVDGTIAYKLLTGRYKVDGTTVDALKSADKQSAAITLEDLYNRYMRMVKKTKYRLLAGDGSGRLAYLKANSGTSQFVVEDDGTTTLSGMSPSWKWLIPGQHIDIVNATTGLGVEGGIDVAISSIVKSTGAIVIPDTVAISASKAYYIRLHTPHSDTTDPDYDSDRALLPEPAGIPGLITGSASLYGYSPDDYPEWYSPTLDLDGAAVGIEHLDELFAELDIESGLVCVGDSAVVSQLRKEMAAKGQIIQTVNKPIYDGVKEIRYQSLVMNQMEVPLLSSPEFNGQRNLFFAQPSVLAEKGSSVRPTWKRGALVNSEGSNYVFDDLEWRYERYTQRRKCHGSLTNCGAAYGWNKVTE